MKKVIVACLLAILTLNTPIASVDAQSNANESAQNRGQERRDAVQLMIQERIETIQQRVETRNVKVSRQVCENRETALRRAIPHLSQGAESVKSTIDSVYVRAQRFYEEGQLSVENYEELIAIIDESQSDSEAALGAIDAYEFELDCENSNVGEQLDGFRVAVKNARSELKEYRDALVVLISTMRTEAAEENPTESISENANVS